MLYSCTKYYILLLLYLHIPSAPYTNTIHPLPTKTPKEFNVHMQTYNIHSIHTLNVYLY